MKDNIYYKTIRRWFKNRRKKQNANRVIYFRRSLFYLRPIRYWLSKITVRYSDSPRGSLRRHRRSTAQRYHQTIEKNQQGLLRSQNRKGETQWNQSVGGAPYARYFQYNRKKIFPNKNQLQWVSGSLKQQYPYSKGLSYIFKNVKLIGDPPFIDKIPVLSLIDIKLSDIVIFSTLNIQLVGPLVAVVGENNLSNITSMRSSNQKAAVDCPICFVTDEMLGRLQTAQNDNERTQVIESKEDQKEDQKKDQEDWLSHFNWNDKWDPELERSEGGMIGRFGSDMAWDTTHWYKSLSDNSFEDRNEEKEPDKPDNEWGPINMEIIEKYKNSPEGDGQTCLTSNMNSYTPLEVEKLTGTNLWSKTTPIHSILLWESISEGTLNHISKGNQIVTAGWPSD